MLIFHLCYELIICKQYGGVWALDQLPKFIDPLPRIYVINTQESTNTHSGHWVCIFSEGGQFDFFDSYGKNPDFYSTLLCDFMQNTEGDTRVNRKRLRHLVQYVVIIVFILLFIDVEGNL